MPPQPQPQPGENEIGSLERRRERLYDPVLDTSRKTPLMHDGGEKTLPHGWAEAAPTEPLARPVKHVRFAGIFFVGALIFFAVSLAIAAFVFLIGGNSVSADKITIAIQGPTTIVGGDMVPLSLTITNKNAVAIENATIEIEFPSGTRNAGDVTQAYPRYLENLGTLASGQTVTRSIRTIMFGGEGQTLTLPISLSYGTAGSNSTFVKKSSYSIVISATPLSVSVEAPAETVSGQQMTLVLTVRSNASVPLDNVVLAGTFPFGFTAKSASIPMNDSTFSLGTLAPGAQTTVRLVGTLAGQDKEQRVFHFTVGTAKSAQDRTLAVSYMTQNATVAVTAPFIETSIAVNGNTSSNIVLAPGSRQNVTLSYVNTLSTSVTNAVITVAISGSAVDYDSIQATNGFYNSSDHTVVFSRDADPALATLAPGASGIDNFSFNTLPTNSLSASPTITFTTSVSGSRAGQSNVPEQVTASVTKTAKVATAVALAATSFHTTGPFVSTGPIPPVAGQPTTYSVVWNVTNQGSAVADGIVRATLPTYVTYTGVSTGTGSISYDEKERTIMWSVGDLAQSASAQAAFQISFTPSTSQKNSSPQLVSTASFTGYDRFAGAQVAAVSDPITTESKGDPGYTSSMGNVQ